MKNAISFQCPCCNHRLSKEEWLARRREYVRVRRVMEACRNRVRAERKLRDIRWSPRMINLQFAEFACYIVLVLSFFAAVFWGIFSFVVAVKLNFWIALVVFVTVLLLFFFKVKPRLEQVLERRAKERVRKAFSLLYPEYANEPWVTS